MDYNALFVLGGLFLPPLIASVIVGWIELVKKMMGR